MKWRLYIIALFLFTLTSPGARAQGVVVHAASDSLKLWVGDQTRIHLEVTCNTGQTVAFPLVTDTLVRGIEVLHPILSDTTYMNQGKRMTITRHYRVTSFDSTMYYIPPFEVLVDSIPYSSGTGLALGFYMFDVDTLNANQFFGPKEILGMPMKWGDLDTSAYSLALFVLLFIVAVFLIMRYKDNKPIIRIVKLTPKRPAHEVALERINRMTSEGDARNGDAKEYYTELTDVIRAYIKERFNFDATEMTSSEILDRLMKEQSKEALADLRELLLTADLVKFAKLVPHMGENEKNLLTAMEFVKKTLIKVDPNAPKPKEQEVIVEEKRSKAARMAILVSIIATILVATAALFYLIRQIYYLFF